VALKGTRAVAAGVVGAVGSIAFFRWLSRPRARLHEHSAVREPAPTPPVERDPDPRAAALRAKLEDPEPGAEPAADEPESAEPSPEDRRREVHAAAESTVRAMRRSSGS
jgi:hypothetical protein